MYHQWDKQLRDWLSMEIRRCFHAPHLAAEFWRRSTDEIVDFLTSWGWDVRAAPFFRDLSVCGLVVNVYKHGNGRSLDELRRTAPELAGHRPNTPEFLRSAMDYTDLAVNDEDLQRFADAISAFWRDVPENTFQSSITDEPDWVRKALAKDAS